MIIHEHNLYPFHPLRRLVVSVHFTWSIILFLIFRIIRVTNLTLLEENVNKIMHLLLLLCLCFIFCTCVWIKALTNWSSYAINATHTYTITYHYLYPNFIRTKVRNTFIICVCTISEWVLFHTLWFLIIMNLDATWPIVTGHVDRRQIKK